MVTTNGSVLPPSIDLEKETEMIEPGDLHRHFIVRHVPTGRDLWTDGWDARYEVFGLGGWDYRISTSGTHLLARSPIESHPWGVPLRLSDIDPLPDGRGRFHPDAIASRDLSLRLSYEGSWRQFADMQMKRVAA
jgi:hypothetical protein